MVRCVPLHVNGRHAFHHSHGARGERFHEDRERGRRGKYFQYDVGTMESGDVSLQPSLVEFFERPEPRPSGTIHNSRVLPLSPSPWKTAYSIHAEGRPDLDVNDVGSNAIEPSR